MIASEVNSFICFQPPPHVAACQEREPQDGNEIVRRDQNLHPSCRWFARTGPRYAGRMTQRLRESFSDRRIAVVASLGLLTLFTLAMLAGRMAYTGTRGHGWLAWNLFLAWIPFLPSRCCSTSAPAPGHRCACSCRSACSGLSSSRTRRTCHRSEARRRRRPRPGALRRAAALGRRLDRAAARIDLALPRPRGRAAAVGALDAWALVVGVLALSSFGIYLGRVQRWNSLGPRGRIPARSATRSAGPAASARSTRARSA